MLNIGTGERRAKLAGEAHEESNAIEEANVRRQHLVLYCIGKSILEGETSFDVVPALYSSSSRPELRSLASSLLKRTRTFAETAMLEDGQPAGRSMVSSAPPGHSRGET
jgi:hypothetical protein